MRRSAVSSSTYHRPAHPYLRTLLVALERQLRREERQQRREVRELQRIAVAVRGEDHDDDR